MPRTAAPPTAVVPIPGHPATPAAGACRFCRCTQGRACLHGCYWLEPELCSRCGWRVGRGVVMALDPSVNDLGVAAVAFPGLNLLDSITWHPSGAKGAPERFDQIADFVFTWCRELRLTDVVVEIPDGGERYYRDKTGQRRQMGGSQERIYAQAVGACRAAARLGGANVWPVSVNQWKGRSRKSETAPVILARFGLLNVASEGRTHNELDALGLADWWINVGRRQAGGR